MFMKSCPECGSSVKSIGDSLFCLDCEWDDLPVLKQNGVAAVFGDGMFFRIPEHEGPLPDGAVEIGSIPFSDGELVLLPGVTDPQGLPVEVPVDLHTDLYSLCSPETLGMDVDNPFYELAAFVAESSVASYFRMISGLFPSISGRHLDRLGLLLGCHREANESDDSYRRRILERRMEGRCEV